MSQPPNLIIYNADKKIVQLSKVVSNLTFKIDEHFFQLNFLNEFYGNQFQNIFDIHEENITKIISEIQKHQNKVEEEMSIMYSESFQNHKEEFDNNINTMKQSIEKEQNKYLSEIGVMKKEIAEICSQLTQLTSTLSEPLTDIFSNAAGETIPAILERNEKEIQLLDKESEKKLNSLNEETKNKMKSFDSSYGKIVDNLKKQFYASTKDVDKFKPFLELQEQFKILNLEIQNKREEFTTIEKDYLSQITNFRQKFNDYFNEYNESYLIRQSEISNLENGTENTDLSLLERLKQQYEEMKQKFCEEITKAQSEMAKMLLVQKAEKEKMHSLVHSTESLSDDQLNELKERQQQEFDQIKAQYEKLYPPLIQSNEESKRNLDEQLKLYQTDENEFKKQLNTQKEEHSKEIKTLKDQQDDDMHLEYAKFESKMAVLHKKLGHNKLLLSDSKCAEEQKEQLQKEISEIKEKHENWINEFDSDFQKEKENQLIQNNEELEKIKKEEEEKLNELNDKSKLEFNMIENEFAKKKEELRLSYEDKYQSNLKTIPQEFKDQSPIASLTQSYVTQYQDLSKLLDEEMKDVKIQSNEKDLQQAIEEKNELIATIEKNKASLLKKIKDSEEDEIKRHEFTLTLFVPLHSDDELESKRKEVQEKINRLVQRQDDLLFTLRQLREVKKPKISVSGFLEEEEVLNLRKKLEVIRDELQDQRHKKQIEYEEAIAQKNDEIELTIKMIEENYQNEIINLENEKTMKNEEIAQLKQKQIDNLSQAEINYNDFQEKFAISLEKLKKDIENDLQNQKLIIEAEKENNKNNEIDLNTQLKESKKNSKKEYKQLILDIEKEKKIIAEKRDECMKRLEDHFIEAEKLCAEAKKRAENIPMRPEERDEIDRLENQLSLKTQQLNAIAKDMMSYKNRLKQQEDEYNKRFGVSPQVAIMRASDQRRTQKSALIKKPLPPLKNSLVC